MPGVFASLEEAAAFIIETYPRAYVEDPESPSIRVTSLEKIINVLKKCDLSFDRGLYEFDDDDDYDVAVKVYPSQDRDDVFFFPAKLS